MRAKIRVLGSVGFGLFVLLVTVSPAEATPGCTGAGGSSNLTTVVSLDLKAAMQGIAYQACYSGDANSNNFAIAQYKQNSATQWLDAYTTVDLAASHTCTDTPVANLQNI